MSKVLSAAQIPDKYEFTEFNTIARVCYAFPFSLSVMHVSVCSQRGLYQTASSLSFVRKSAGMNANEQRRAARLRVASRLANRVFARLCSFVFIPANLHAKESTRSPGLHKPPTSMKLFSLLCSDTLFTQAPVLKRISSADRD